MKKNPEAARQMVAAVREGWRTYLDDPKATNEKMHEMNPSMDAETFAAIAEVQKALIETAETGRDKLGMMTKARWKMLAAQLRDLGDIAKAPAAEDCFRVL